MFAKAVLFDETSNIYEARKAVTIMEDVLRINTRTLGPMHPDTCRNRSDLDLMQKRVGRAEGEWREFKEWSLRHWKVYSTKYPGLSDQELMGKMKDAWCALKRKQTPLQK